ncbi:MAG: phosphopantetheine-binding protein [Roseiarcus sp.]|jgi:acyl carrier protein
MPTPHPSLSSKPFDFADLVALIKRLVSEGDLPSSAADVELTADTRLEDIGLDSLGKLTLLEELELASDVELPEDFIDADASLGEVIDRLNAILGA